MCSINPFFTIITVCYNAEKTISKTIEYVLNQSYKDYEYLIIDGKSTDGTVGIIKKYEEKFNGKLKWISEVDSGIYDAMNKGIRLARGELIGIINSDDWYELDTLESIILNYKNQSVKESVYYGLMRNFRNNMECLIGAYKHDFLHEVMIPHSTCFVHKKLYDKYGSFNLEYKLAADYDLMLRFYSLSVNFVFIPQILANFQYGGATDQFKYRSLIETFKIQSSYNVISKTRKNYKILNEFITFIIGKIKNVFK